MENLIGKYYSPFDNSFCINLKTGESAMIVQKSLNDFEYYGPNPEEENAHFEIVSNPYKEVIFFIDKRTKEFINVKSSKTGNIYRTLYTERRVL